MPTTRYYYTDRFDAMWMARYFGMEFVKEDGSEFGWRAENVPNLSVLTKSPFYLHPNSVHLLEPMYGDKVGNYKTSFYVQKETEETFNGDECITLEQAKDFPAAGRWQINKRNGKAFMWPEKEEDDANN